MNESDEYVGGFNNYMDLSALKIEKINVKCVSYTPLKEEENETVTRIRN